MSETPPSTDADHTPHGAESGSAPDDAEGIVGMAVLVSVMSAAGIAYVTFMVGGLLLSGVAISGTGSDAATLVILMCLPLVFPVIAVIAGIAALTGLHRRPRGGGEAAPVALAMSALGAVIPVPVSLFVLAGGQTLGLPLLFSLVQVILWGIAVRRLSRSKGTSPHAADPAVRGA